MDNTSIISSNNMTGFHLGGTNFSPFEASVFLSFVIPLIIFTLISNSFVIYSISTFVPLKNPSNIYLVSLAITDIFCALFVMPIACHYSVVGVWHFGTIGCQMWIFCSFLSSTSSTFHLCAIALDRYHAIAHPMPYAMNRSNSKTFFILSMLWTGSILMTSPAILTDFGFQWPKEDDENDDFCAMPVDPNIATYACLGTTYFPFLIIVGIYMQLYRVNRARLKKKRYKPRIKRVALEGINSISNATREESIINSNNILRVERSSNYSNIPRMGNHNNNINSNIINSNVININNGSNNNSNRDNIDIIVEEDKRGVTAIKHSVVISKRRKRKPKRKIRLSLLDININLEVIAPKCNHCQVSMQELRRSHRRRRDSSINSHLCQICSVPNDIILAAERSRLAILLQKERRFMFIISVILCTFILCWMPATTAYMVSQYMFIKVSPRVISGVWWLVYANSACNPVIYTIFNRDFRQAFVKLFR